MSTTYDPDQRDPVPRRTARCLRHHVWMAACDDCRDAHAVSGRTSQREAKEPVESRGTIAA